MIKCPICGVVLGCLTNMHAAQHGFESKEKLIEAHPEAKKRSCIFYGSSVRNEGGLYGQQRFYEQNNKKKR